MGPIIMQWEGKGPEPLADEIVTRNLRASAERNASTAAQTFYTRHSKSQHTVSPIQLPTGGRKLQEGDLHHIVTFQDCVFKVRVRQHQNCGRLEYLALTHIILIFLPG